MESIFFNIVQCRCLRGGFAIVVYFRFLFMLSISSSTCVTSVICLSVVFVLRVENILTCVWLSEPRATAWCAGMERMASLLLHKSHSMPSWWCVHLFEGFGNARPTISKPGTTNYRYYMDTARITQNNHQRSTGTTIQINLQSGYW